MPNDYSSKTKISNLIIMGDSLSDRGTLSKRKLLGFISMKVLSGLRRKSPKGRFTNGYTWTDDLCVRFANQFILQSLKTDSKLMVMQKKQSLSSRSADLADDILSLRHTTAKKVAISKQALTRSDDIADALIANERQIKDKVRQFYHLNDDQQFKYRDRGHIRFYVEGGLTASDYSFRPSTSIVRFFTRLILSSLKKKLKQLFKYDRDNKVTAQHKRETLVVEWSGANDLITANKRPSIAAADRAVAARINNARELIKQGYRNIVLFNLPDLGLTPRYQRKSPKECRNASNCSSYFNQKLQQEVEKLIQELNAQHVDHNIKVFDIAEKFNEMYREPQLYNLNKINQPFVESKDFKITAKGTSPAAGYMFWDDVHPTAHVHSLLSEKFFNEFGNQFTFTAPKEKSDDNDNVVDHVKEKLKLRKSMNDLNFPKASGAS